MCSKLAPVRRNCSLENTKGESSLGWIVYRKYKVIIENYTSIDPLKKAYVDLLICWRNRMLKEFDDKDCPTFKRIGFYDKNDN